MCSLIILLIALCLGINANIVVAQSTPPTLSPVQPPSYVLDPLNRLYGLALTIAWVALIIGAIITVIQLHSEDPTVQARARQRLTYIIIGAVILGLITSGLLYWIVFGG